MNDLALFELQTVTGEWLVPLPLDPAFPPSLFYRFERPSATEAYSRLVDRANKCTLLFGLYKDNEEGSTDNNAAAVPVQAVTILHGRHTTNAELVEFLKGRNLTTSTSKESLSVFAASQSVSYYGTPLSRGFAAPVRRRGQILDPLPDLLAERRPNSGILKNFSLSRLTHTVRTSMEPELALLMANLGVGTSPNPTSILDPFMGAGIILLAAAILNPECSMLGSDKNVDSTSADKILQNFAQFNRKPPAIFHMQDVAQLDLAPSSLDCIVTDPPYDMKAKITGGGDFESAILLPLLRLASQSLKPNGRLVFYCPRAPPTTQQLETYGLDVVKIFEQRLSPTFSRFLCVIQNRD